MRGQPSVALTEALLSGVSAELEQESKLELLKLVAAGDEKAVGQRVSLDFSPRSLGRFPLGERWADLRRSLGELPPTINGTVLRTFPGKPGMASGVVIEADDDTLHTLELRVFILGL